MKKKIFGLALLAISMLSFTAAAGDNDTKCDKKCANTAQCTKGGKECKKDALCPFEGLNLSEAQQLKVKALQEKQQVERKAKKEGEKAKKEARKAERKLAKENYLKELKSILTPEQYVQFLENQYLRTEKAAKMKAREIKQDFKKDGRRGDIKGRMLTNGEKKAQDKK